MVESVRALLERAVDYAGLFPPAALAMEPTVANFARYRAGDNAWALGRFVVPAARLDELIAAAEPWVATTDGPDPWPVAALGGNDIGADVQRVVRFNVEQRRRGPARMLIDAFEWKAASAERVREGAALLPAGVAGYAELPLGAAIPGLVDAVAEAGVRAKVRTGGVTADAFPSTAALAEFIVECGRAEVAFKATAGLHHPLRNRYALTYEPGSATATMFGYLNVFVAALFVAAGAGAAEVAPLLETALLDELTFTDGGVRWRGRTVSTAEIRAARSRGVIAFGSCSFTEPLSDLAALLRR